MMKSVWDLIKEGSFEAACQAADEEMANSTSTLPMRNKIIALLNLAEYEKAISLSATVIEKTGGSTDTDFIFLGVAQWLQGDSVSAIANWRKATGTDYTDAAGGVEAPLLLFYAAAKSGADDLRSESLKLLKKLCRPKSKLPWPGPLASYVLGQIDEQALRGAIDQQPILAAKQTCQADFYVGLMNLTHGESRQFSVTMERAISHVPFALQKCEFYLARNELLEV
ncbi:MAG: hypothetical protein ACJ73N_13035 [Bryobacteraceae bacterium]